MNVGSTVVAIDPLMFGKTAMPVVPRLAANPIVVANATPEDADVQKLGNMRSLNSSQVPSKLGNNEPAVIPIILRSFITWGRAAAGRS